MARITYFVVQPFEKNDEGEIFSVEPREARDGGHARRLGLQLAATHGGAVSFSRTGDPSLGDWEDAEVIASFGIVPDDLSMLSG
jgi:hypothetical protein